MVEGGLKLFLTLFIYSWRFSKKSGCALPYSYEASESGAPKKVKTVRRTLAHAATDGRHDCNSAGNIADAASVAAHTWRPGYASPTQT